jgi:hypothetical protein
MTRRSGWRPILLQYCQSRYLEAFRVEANTPPVLSESALRGVQSGGQYSSSTVRVGISRRSGWRPILLQYCQSRHFEAFRVEANTPPVLSESVRGGVQGVADLAETRIRE